MAIILLVEDDPVSRRSIAGFLRMAGYDVYEAQDGETPLVMLSRMRFDFVISDLIAWSIKRHRRLGSIEGVAA